MKDLHAVNEKGSMAATWGGNVWTLITKDALVNGQQEEDEKTSHRQKVNAEVAWQAKAEMMGDGTEGEGEMLCGVTGLSRNRSVVQPDFSLLLKPISGWLVQFYSR